MDVKQLKKEIKAKEEGICCDEIRIRKGKVEIKRSYFYTHGQSAEKMATGIDLVLGLTAAGHKVSHEDRYASWPKISYFVVIVEPKADNQNIKVGDEVAFEGKTSEETGVVIRIVLRRVSVLVTGTDEEIIDFDIRDLEKIE